MRSTGGILPLFQWYFKCSKASVQPKNSCNFAKQPRRDRQELVTINSHCHLRTEGCHCYLAGLQELMEIRKKIGSSFRNMMTFFVLRSETGPKKRLLEITHWTKKTWLLPPYLLMSSPEPSQSILLMSTRNPINSPGEVGSLSHYLHRVLAPSQVVGKGISEPSTVWFSSKGRDVFPLPFIPSPFCQGTRHKSR